MRCVEADSSVGIPHDQRIQDPVVAAIPGALSIAVDSIASVAADGAVVHQIEAAFAPVSGEMNSLCAIAEEGATQLFKPLISNDQILGAVGVLQFEVVAQRLRDEYKVECQFETVGVQQARWIRCQDEKMLYDFRKKLDMNLSLDHAGELVYLAPTRINLQMSQERWPDVEFLATREQVFN